MILFTYMTKDFFARSLIRLIPCKNVCGRKYVASEQARLLGTRQASTRAQGQRVMLGRQLAGSMIGPMPHTPSSSSAISVGNRKVQLCEFCGKSSRPNFPSSFLPSKTRPTLDAGSTKQGWYERTEGIAHWLKAPSVGRVHVKFGESEAARLL